MTEFELIKKILSAIALSALAVSALSSCGSSDSDAGAQACTIYHDALKDSPETITDSVALDEIKGILSKADTPTRRAFSALITAAAANPFSSSTDPNAVDQKGVKVREVCLSEHSIEIPAY